MKASYISYYEGYDVTGKVIYNGNGSFMIEYDEVEGIDPSGILTGHSASLLEDSQKDNPFIVRILIKSIARL